jgi:hypothetical protein
MTVRVFAFAHALPPVSRYTHLPAADRRAILDILRDTKQDLSNYFRS